MKKIPYFNKYGGKGEKNLWESFEAYKAGDPPILIMDNKTDKKTIKAAQSANYKRNLKMKALTENESFNPKEEEKEKQS